MAEREFRTTPQWPIVTTPLSGDELVEVWKGGKQYYVPFSELGGMPAAHSGTHKHGGDDEVGTLDNLAYEIPKLDADGLIDSRVSDASTTTKGKVQLAADGEEDATKPPASTDSRLKDARPPTAHAVQHIAGTDVIADATVSNSGLMSAADKVKADAIDTALIPSNDEKAALGVLSPVVGALAGSYGTPSATNKYVTESDPVLSSIGGGGGTTGPDLLGIGQIGEGLTIASILSPSITSLNSTDIAFIGATNEELRLYRWSGTAWSLQGSLSISGAASPSIAALTETDVAFIDEANDELRLYSWSGTAWSLQGSGLSVEVTSPTITALNATDIALFDSYNRELRVYRWNGSVWTLYGSGFSISDAFTYSSITAITSTEVAFIDAINNELRLYHWSGAEWSQYGKSLSISGASYFSSLAKISSTDILLIIDNEICLYRWSGIEWGRVGIAKQLEATIWSPVIAGITSTSIAYYDAFNAELRTYNFLFGYDSASVNIAADYEVPEIATGKSIVIRRTSAYDGNPVTISPPSGATLEGRASLSLYGQYSFVELERISETVFAIVDYDDMFNFSPTLSFNGASTGITYQSKSGTARISKKEVSGEVRIELSNKGTSVGGAEINLIGCPNNKAGIIAGAVPLVLEKVSFVGQYCGYVADGTPIIRLRNTSEAGSLVPISNTSFSNESIILVSFVYGWR